MSPQTGLVKPLEQKSRNPSQTANALQHLARRVVGSPSRRHPWFGFAIRGQSRLPSSVVRLCHPWVVPVAVIRGSALPSVGSPVFRHPWFGFASVNFRFVVGWRNS